MSPNPLSALPRLPNSGAVAIDPLAAWQTGATIAFMEQFDLAFNTLRVESVLLSAPPGNEQDGQAWIVSGASGVADPTLEWEGHRNDIAYWFNGWRFITPKGAWVAFAIDVADFVYFNPGRVPPEWTLDVKTVEDNIIADPLGLQGGSPLAEDINIVTVIASNNDSVTLAANQLPGRAQVVFNETNNRTLAVFPPSGESINGEIADVPFLLPARTSITPYKHNLTDWITL